MAFVINDAQDRVLIVADVLLPLFEDIKDRVDIERVIVFPFGGKAIPAGYEDYEIALQGSAVKPIYPQVDERDAVSMCYTSGTTGRPKGASIHIARLLCTLIPFSLPESFSISRNDTILPALSMFHANAWGMPYAAVMNGSKLVLPGPNLRPQALLELLSAERVTLTGAVPTVWLPVVEALENEPQRWPLVPELRMVIAGSACPESLFRRFDRFKVRVIQARGLTETTPMRQSTISTPIHRMLLMTLDISCVRCREFLCHSWISAPQMTRARCLGTEELRANCMPEVRLSLLVITIHPKKVTSGLTMVGFAPAT
jgi:fatty-acyl-CoA synthase